jgi:hypothetical protein
MNITKRVRELKKQGMSFDFIEGWLSGYGEASEEDSIMFDKKLDKLEKDMHKTIGKR